MNGRKQCCVIADDVRLYREMLRRWMSELGFDCHLATTGQDALAAAERYGPDLIVTDIDMPNTNGIELTRSIRAHRRPEIREIPILIISSLQDAQVDTFVRQFGGSGFCAKPLDKTRFVHAVTKITDDQGVAPTDVESDEMDPCVISHLLRQIVREQDSSDEAERGAGPGGCDSRRREDPR